MGLHWGFHEKGTQWGEDVSQGSGKALTVGEQGTCLAPGGIRMVEGEGGRATQQARA